MSTKKSLGILGLQLTGEYVPGQSYKKRQTVTYEGASYAAKMDTSLSPNHADAWLKLAEKGERGEKGDSFKFTDFTSAQLLALQGAPGKSFVAAGLYATIDELQTAIPDGSAVEGFIGVGTEAPYTYYAWISVNGTGKWVSQGQLQGGDGKSAYQLAQENGYTGTETEWLASLKGTNGKNGTNGQDGQDGANGKSAYQLARENGYTGTEAEWLESLKGKDGKSAYQAYVESVAEGTEPLTLSEWILSLRGEDGKSTYDLYVESLPEGETPLSLEEWIASLRGKDGLTGQNGADGGPGKSAYQSYLEAVPDGTTPLTEAEWSRSLLGGFDVSKIQIIPIDDFDPSVPDNFEDGVLYIVGLPI